MKVSQIVALSATLIFQAEACVRIRVDRYIHDSYGTIQDMKLYDNDNAVVKLPFPVNFRTSDDNNVLHLGGYTVELNYKDDKRHPYGGRIDYPNGCKSAGCVFTLENLTDSETVAPRDLQGKAYQTYVDGNGRTHDLYCFSDDYSNCGNYVCGI
jgi:hypothetical protein